MSDSVVILFIHIIYKDKKFHSYIIVAIGYDGVVCVCVGLRLV